MKYVDEFRDGTLAAGLARAIARGRQRPRLRLHGVLWRPHHAISRYGVADLLPANVRMIHGPGCPVCVLPIGRGDMADLACAGAPRGDPVHLRRPPARARLRRPFAAEGRRRAAPTCAWCIPRPTRSRLPRARAGARGGVLRHRLRGPRLRSEVMWDEEPASAATGLSAWRQIHPDRRRDRPRSVS